MILLPMVVMEFLGTFILLFQSHILVHLIIHNFCFHYDTLKGSHHFTGERGINEEN